MLRWIGTILFFLPALAGFLLADLAARLIFGMGLAGVLEYLGEANIGDTWAAVWITWGLGSLSLLAAGALYSIVWNNASLLGAEVVAHIYLGRDLGNRDHYVSTSDPGGERVTVSNHDSSDLYPATGFASVYLRHLLTKNALGSKDWQRLTELTTANLMWPIFVAPLVYLVGQGLSAAPVSDPVSGNTA